MKLQSICGGDAMLQDGMSSDPGQELFTESSGEPASHISSELTWGKRLGRVCCGGNVSEQCWALPQQQDTLCLQTMILQLPIYADDLSAQAHHISRRI